MREKTQVAKYMVSEYHKATGSNCTIDKVFVVWQCKTLQNWKAILGTSMENDESLFEVTYNGDKNEYYIDVYNKAQNVAQDAQAVEQEMSKRGL